MNPNIKAIEMIHGGDCIRFTVTFNDPKRHNGLEYHKSFSAVKPLTIARMARLMCYGSRVFICPMGPKLALTVYAPFITPADIMRTLQGTTKFGALVFKRGG